MRRWLTTSQPECPRESGPPRGGEDHLQQPVENFAVLRYYVHGPAKTRPIDQRLAENREPDASEYLWSSPSRRPHRASGARRTRPQRLLEMVGIPEIDSVRAAKTLQGYGYRRDSIVLGCPAEHPVPADEGQVTHLLYSEECRRSRCVSRSRAVLWRA